MFHACLKSFTKEAHWLAAEFAVAAASSGRTSQLTCEMSIIRLHDAWARFCRELVIVSACGGVTKSGASIARAPAVKLRSDVIPQLFATYTKKRTYEPKWASASECIDAAQRLRLTNFGTIAGALAANNSPAEEIRKIRNFYAHRGAETASKAASTGAFVTACQPRVFDLNDYRSGGETAIASWVRNLCLVAYASTA